MKPIHCVRRLTLLVPVLGALLFSELAVAQAPPPAPPTLPSETPAQFTPVTDSFDYARREVMIPMRDGVKLHTVILVPKGAKNAPILLTRTPYDAFRELNMPYIYDQEATRKSDEHWWTSNYDDYDLYLQAGSAGELGRRHGLEQVGFWRKLLDHPAYDSWWQQQAMDKILAAQPLKVPTMLVASLWDQEDIYGAIAVYKALKPKDTGNDKVFLVMGPWHHGQEIDDASTLGALKFSSDTRLYFRREILAPFLARYLKDDAPKSDVAPVSAFETGTNIWRRLPAWPAGCASGCGIKPTPLYLNAGLKLSFSAPAAGEAPFDEYVSDPAKPVPYRALPVQAVGYSSGMTWSQWLVG